MARIACALLLVATLLVAGAARAQSPQDEAAAEALFLEGRKLIDKGQLREACAKFAASQKLSPGAGTLLNLGDCYEREGRTAAAWATFREAIDAARTAGRADREKMARERAQILEPKLARIQVTIRSRPEGLALARDGV